MYTNVSLHYHYFVIDAVEAALHEVVSKCSEIKSIYTEAEDQPSELTYTLIYVI